MRLLVTRPESDSIALRAQLIAHGHDVFVEPLMTIEYHPPEDIDLGDVQALIATSRNGLRALGQSSLLIEAQKLPIYVVGPGTASAAKALGFSHVIEGPRDANALLALIALDADINGGALLYLSGEVTSSDIGGELRRLGFHVLEPVTYSTVPLTELSAPIAERFRGGQIDGVLLLSPQTARIYTRVILGARLAPLTTRITHFCLSATVARGLLALSPPKIVNAAQPNLQELLAVIARTAPQSP